MNKVTVNASKSYDIIIGGGILKDSGKYIKDISPICTAVIVTDDNVDKLYSEVVETSLNKAGYKALKFVFKHSESSKNINTFNDILEFLASNKITRTDMIIALGGGVVGDVAGFCAATYLRGIKYVQIPTTFLACVDSSVGGKTAINLNSGKNLAGAFWQPSLVICDYSTLNTLSEDVFNDGVAEAIKYAFIKSKSLYTLLKDGKCKDNIEEIITECVTIKRDIVNEDEFDTGKRQLLNFGHTIGHCIEKLSKFEITHGKAVAIGMYVVIKASYKSGICKLNLTDDLENILNDYSLPLNCDFDANSLFEVAVNDKKRTGTTINLVVPQELNKCVLHKIEISDLEEFIKLGL